MGNKGGVSISFTLHDTTMKFICCHLHSGLDGVSKRNADIKDIMNSLVYPKVSKSSSTKVVAETREKVLPEILIFLGDLNYRINGFKPSIMQCIGQDRYDLLIQSEQLLIEKQLGNIPTQFQEGEIAFAPTFKRAPYDNTTFKLKRNPAWTDRILYYAEHGLQQLKLEAYDANNLVSLSDHRPVFAQFHLYVNMRDVAGMESSLSEEEGKRADGISSNTRATSKSVVSLGQAKELTETAIEKINTERKVNNEIGK